VALKGELMGSVYKETYTKPLPAEAKIIVRKGQRLAEWIDAKGKRRVSPLTTAGDRITIEAGTYTAKFRDGSGVVRKVSTGCRDESAARSILGKLERRAELVKGEVLTSAEDAVIDHQGTPLADHIAAFIDHQRAKGVTPQQVAHTESRLNRVVRDCGFDRLADLSASALERWLAGKQGESMGAVTRNAYREACVTFANWCVRNRRLLGNPFVGVSKADAKADPRHKRRALTEDELNRLLDVARQRPLIEAMTIRRGEHKGEAVAVIREDTRRCLERLGQERALIYKTLVLTGLRKGELASITVGQVVLDADMPYLILNAADEKNREGSTIPLRADLADDLRRWLADKATALQEAAQRVPAVRFDSKPQKRRKRNQSDSTGREGHSCQPLTTLPRLPADTPLLTVPAGLVRILDRDLVAAGIARRVEVDGKWKINKRDERGRVVDVHALRTTFGTLLSKAGVAPRTAQAAMRHSKIDLTMNTYTDPKLLDVAGAIDALPALPLTDGKVDCTAGENVLVTENILAATGTDGAGGRAGARPSALVPNLVPTTGKPCMLQSIVDKAASATRNSNDSTAVAASACVVKRKALLTTLVNRASQVEPTGIEPATSWMQTTRSPN
jgi:integrase